MLGTFAKKCHWMCSTLLLLPVGTICRYKLMKTILRLNLMKLYALSNFWCISLVQVFSWNFMDCRKMIGFIYAWLRYGTNRWRVKPRHRAKADSSRLSVAKERKSPAPSEDEDGGFTLNVSMGAEKMIKRESTLRD